MANKTLTAANSIITLSVPNLIPSPVQLQGFATDNIFESDAVETAETKMGVDGNLSAGIVLVETPFTVHLQADSDSNLLFETWDQTQQQQKDVYFGDITVALPSVQRVYTLTKVVLKTSNRLPNAARTMQPRAYHMVAQSVVGAPI